MEYKYELHCHTGNVSLCADVEPKKLVEKYMENGYNGIVLTDHYSPMTFYKKIISPQKMIEHYLSSYRELKDYCGNDFTVLLGLELRHYGTVNDYLVYGIDENWLMRQPNMLRWNEEEMCRKIHQSGGLVYQAHPCRPFIRKCRPEYIDGIEIFNGHTKTDDNKKAAEWAKKLRKPTISGSDFHSEKDKICGGITTNTPIKNNSDLLRILKTRNYELIRQN